MVELITKYSVDAVIPVGKAPVVVKYTLLPSANQCDVYVTTHGAAIVIVAVPIDVADCIPTGTFPLRFGKLKVVDPSHAP